MTRLLEALNWAARAIRREIIGFRFRYPIEIVSTAGMHGSPHYHIYSPHLFADAMVLDADGVPRQRFRQFGETYNPAYVAWYGLNRLEGFLRGVEPDGRAVFLRQMEWLEARGVRRGDGSVVWPLTIDWREGACRLTAPWISAMAQGLPISALVRCHRLTGRRQLLDLCRAATLVFEKNVEDGGLRTLERGHALYEEYPAYPLPRVLDGFLFGLLGLYDLMTETGDQHISQLFWDGVGGLAQTLRFWDYRGKWSWYGAHGYLCPPHYHRLNAALLMVLGRLTGETALVRFGDAWSATPRTLTERIEIFAAFAATKNLARLKFTWMRG